jgi:cytochrome c oxidase cbb3-type subunit 4
MDFDKLNLLRSAVTLASFALFTAIMVWTFQRKHRESFDEAAALPFLDDASSSAQGGKHE